MKATALCCYTIKIIPLRGRIYVGAKIISVIFTIKIGHLVPNFYSKYKQLSTNPPHVIIFSNEQCSKHTMNERPMGGLHNY